MVLKIMGDSVRYRNNRARWTIGDLSMVNDYEWIIYGVRVILYMARCSDSVLVRVRMLQ